MQAANGHPYYAVGRFLIERNIVPKDEMSMDRIREWMERNPNEGKELRRQNKSYVFFRETNLSANEEPIGAQGISLTPGRSIAVDRKLHTYGTPFFISAYLPIEGLKPDTWFRRLMIAQDTGGAIVGPARADLYFGAGDEAASVAGRLRHDGRFVMLVPKELVPVADDEIPLPRRGRPSKRWRPTKRLRPRKKPKPTRRSQNEEQGAGDQAAQKPGNKSAKTAAKAVEQPAEKSRRRQEVRRRSPSARPNRARQIGRQAGHQAQEQARSSGMSRRRLSERRARPVEGRHPFDRAVAEGFGSRDRRRRARAGCARAEAARQARAHARSRSPRRRSRPAPPPPLATLGRKTKKRIARGAHAIDGRLDLHGMTQAEAHDALFGFLRAKQARGSKVVLVITGKGARGGDDAAAAACSTAWCRSGCGCRNSAASSWASRAPPLGHGGEGALYVSLRKARGA